MNLNIENINSRTLLEFLSLKGWRIFHVGEKYAHFAAPTSLNRTEMLFLPLEKSREMPTYQASMRFLLQKLSAIYRMEEDRLEAILSGSVPALNAEVLSESVQQESKPLRIKDIDRY